MPPEPSCQPPQDRPDHSERMTSDVARLLGRLVRDLIAAATDKQGAREQAVPFVLECVLAMFAEHTGQIPPASFTRSLQQSRSRGDMRPAWSLLDDLGKILPGMHPSSAAPPIRPTLTPAQTDTLRIAAGFNWKTIRPEVFGSIFEQALDPAVRHELGAHFTREADILRVVGPTIVAPWQARIAEIRTPHDAERVVQQLRNFHVLDPACGCGNFLVVVYREVKRLEAALAHTWKSVHGDAATPPPGPWFTLTQLHGIEIEGLAAHLARVVLWLGAQLASRELDTLPRENLAPTVHHADALSIDWPRPAGELAIVGNPPYLGVRKLRRELGDARVEQLFARHPNNRAADYATYWFTRALEVLRPGERAGYVCTNSIAQNESREASIDAILTAGGVITDAWRSYPWPGEAAVHIGIVNWVMSPWHGIQTLEGNPVRSISPGLTQAVDVTSAQHLGQNANLCFMGVTPGNAGFILSDAQRTEIIKGHPESSRVILPFLIGRDVSRDPDQSPARWIIDFATMDMDEAQAYTGAFEHVQRHVHPNKHAGSNRKTDAERGRWWQFVRPRQLMRAAIASLRHVLVIPCVSPHLLVSRQPRTSCFDHQLMVLALSEPYHFGLLQSRLHAIWARARGSTLKGDLRYTNTTIFETFPFPPPSAARDLVTRTAGTFDRLRSAECKRQGLGLTKIHNRLAQDSPLRAAHDAMNDAVAACYGFAPDIWRDEHETLRALLALNHRISGFA